MGMVFGKIDVEVPKHVVLAQRASYQIRQYPALVAATTSKEEDNSAFNRLARYIGVFSTPENQSQAAVAMTAPVLMNPPRPAQPQAIAMTAPVLMAPQKPNQAQTMSFILPATFTKDTAPIPNDPTIWIEEIPAETWAVYVFSGNISSEDDSKVKELQNWLKTDPDYEPRLNKEGEITWKMAYYNPPFTLPWLRTTEAMILVQPTGKEEKKERKEEKASL